MARSPEAEARYKAYQKKYHAERNARARYSYERLEKDYRVVVNGKDLSAELMQRRAPGITGETPWDKDLTVHPYKWRRQGMPKDLPSYVRDAFGDAAPYESFTDPRMLFDCSLFDNMTDEEIAYFNDEKHWVVEKLDTDITLKNELEGEPGVYGYLVHVNRGRKEVNNPPKGRPRYKRKDGKELIWDDPRLDAPWWQECGDYIYVYLNEKEARDSFKQQKMRLDDLNQEVRLYRLTKPISISEARAWLNSDHPLREEKHGAITLDAFGTGQYGRPGELRLPQQPAPDEDEQDRIAEEEYWNSLTPEEQQKTLDDLEYYQALEEKRRQINKERCDAMEPMYTERFNIDTYMASELAKVEAEVEADPDDEEAAEWAQTLRDAIPKMTLDDKLKYLGENMYWEDPDGCEELLRTLNIITPYETQLRLAYVLDPSQWMIEHAVNIHKAKLKNGTETKKLNFRRKDGQYYLNEAQEEYVREVQLDNFAYEGERGSIELLRLVYDNERYPCLDDDQYEEINGFSWETINMEDYRAGRLLPFGDGFPRGAFGPKHDRIEYLADLLKRGEIDVPTFWERVKTNSYVGTVEKFGPDGEESFIITKKNWRQFVNFREERPNSESDSLWYSQFPEELGGDDFVDLMERTYNWRIADWEAWIDSLPDDWYAVNTEAVQAALDEYEYGVLGIDIVLVWGRELKRRRGK
ncbi:hypothetical protein LPB405_08775 [Rothia mucilaginosa]|uniref:hypothetical protein n=1 Tax=Rothia mucilaginosa TaxID=43675 RepID=UPI001C567F80|nr:hypothetical protein [Rothia mucilaginosa]QXW98443.1 hypothetical protein LPB405_08775 [Rothia mucilaginosa]